MTGNVHKFGLGILEKIVNEVGKDLQVNNLFETVKPTCEEMVKSYFPKEEVEINPLIHLGYKLLTKDNVERKEVSIKDIK